MAKQYDGIWELRLPDRLFTPETDPERFSFPEAAERLRVHARQHHVGVSPAGEVVGEGRRARAHHLVGDEQEAVPEAFPQRGGRIGRLAARRGAEVQDPDGPGLQAAPQQRPDEHRRGILHVIGPGVQQRVEREDRPLRKDIALRAPGDGARAFQDGQRPVGGLEGIQPDRHAGGHAHRRKGEGVAVHPRTSGFPGRSRPDSPARPPPCPAPP